MVTAFPETYTVGEFFEQHPDLQFSRLPVYGENRDDITGYVLKYDLLLELAHDHGDSQLSALQRDVLVVSELLPLREFFERLLKSQEHLALVVDEYGGMAGVVTMEDVVETLLGLEIVDEADVVHDMQVLARQQWHKRAKRLKLIPEDSELEELDSDGSTPTE